MRDDLPWRESDIRRGLILFRTSNNAHSTINFEALTFKIEALPQSSKDELAALMRSYAEGLTLAERDAKAGKGLREEKVERLSGEIWDAITTQMDPGGDLTSDGWDAAFEKIDALLLQALIPEPAPAAPCKHERRSPAASPIPSKSWQCDDCGERFADDAPSAHPADLEAAVAAEPRFFVQDGSATAHCCFVASVMDREDPCHNGDGNLVISADGSVYCHAICECLDEDDAQDIADALNAAIRARGERES